jgi:hypothetical protein
MTNTELRDAFALEAMKTISSWNFTQTKEACDEIGRRAYSIADSMMEARKLTDAPKPLRNQVRI